MIDSDSLQTNYSANIQLQLLVGDQIFPLAKIGPKSIVLRRHLPKMVIAKRSFCSGFSADRATSICGTPSRMPRVDRALYTLINDLESRGLLDSTVVMMMDEFGRSPRINKDAGQDHWANVMSMAVAGGNMPHGQVIGSTDTQGYDV